MREGNATTRLHQSDCWIGRHLAACRTRTAYRSDAADRRSGESHRERLIRTAVHLGLPPETTGAGLGGRPQRANRRPVGCRRCRQISEIRDRISSTGVRRHSSDDRASRVAALNEITRSIPIVFVGVFDPVGSGPAANLARPGCNATGFTLFECAISAKWRHAMAGIEDHATSSVNLRTRPCKISA